VSGALATTMMEEAARRGGLFCENRRMTTLTDPSEAAARAGVSIRLAAREDLSEVLRVQHAAFRRVALALNIPVGALPPLRETVEDLEALIDRGFVTYVAETPDSAIAGTVRAETRPDGVVEVGRLAIDDGFQRRGIGLALMVALEHAATAARRFELFTGEDAVEPLALYSKLGYETFRVEEHNGVRLVWLAKDRPDAGA
jgi:ribosomal protein S18 acetylase RimI-like enzyme